MIGFGVNGLALESEGVSGLDVSDCDGEGVCVCVCGGSVVASCAHAAGAVATISALTIVTENFVMVDVPWFPIARRNDATEFPVPAKQRSYAGLSWLPLRH